MAEYPEHHHTVWAGDTLGHPFLDYTRPNSPSWTVNLGGPVFSTTSPLDPTAGPGVVVAAG